MENDIPSYEKWCQRKKLPQDAISRKIYTELFKSMPSLEEIIDLINQGFLHEAHEKLSRYIEKYGNLY